MSIQTRYLARCQIKFIRWRFKLKSSHYYRFNSGTFHYSRTIQLRPIPRANACPTTHSHSSISYNLLPIIPPIHCLFNGFETRNDRLPLQHHYLSLDPLHLHNRVQLDGTSIAKAATQKGCYYRRARMQIGVRFQSCLQVPKDIQLDGYIRASYRGVTKELMVSHGERLRLYHWLTATDEMSI